MRLLVVDDDMAIVNLLSLLLKDFGYEVDPAYDGIEAIERFKSSLYDVAIIDDIMPNMNGSEVCKFIKSHYPNTYIIGISGYSESLKKLKNGGADICLIKPFSIEQIETAIKNQSCLPLPNTYSTAS